MPIEALAAQLRRLRRAGAGVLFGLASLATPVFAQVADSVDPALLNDWRLSRGNEIGFCQIGASTTFGFERALGEEISARLLLNAKFHTMPAGFGIDGEDLEGELYKALVNNCDVFLGIRVATSSFPPEFTVARPYVSFSYVMMARAESGYSRIEDIPRGLRLGSPLATAGDFFLARFIAARQQDDRWMRLPYGDNNQMLDRLLDGTIEAMVLFGPVYREMAERRPEDTARLAPLQIGPELASPANIGGLMLSRNAFMRGEIDAAIADMVQDGTVDALLAAHALAGPGTIAGGF